MNGNFRPTAAAGLIAAVPVGGAFDAAANSRMTVQNDSADKMRITVFNGGDSACLGSEKVHHVGPGNSKGMGCEGKGKHRCKIMIEDLHAENRGKACQEELWNACCTTTINVPNKATVIKSQSRCTIKGD